MYMYIFKNQPLIIWKFCNLHGVCRAEDSEGISVIAGGKNAPFLYY